MAADLSELAEMIRAALPGAEVEVRDEGGGDHLRAVVSSAEFEGLSRIDQHRLVRAAVRSRFDDGSDPRAVDRNVHAGLTLSVPSTHGS